MLSDTHIKHLLGRDLVIAPFKVENVRGASIDLTVSSTAFSNQRVARLEKKDDQETIGISRRLQTISRAYWCKNRLHIPDILVFAALLGLGAPFWFNLLKNLSNLRPALAKLLDADSDKQASSVTK